MADASERRQHPRVPIRSLRITLINVYSRELLGTVADLSRGGLLLYAHHLVEAGATLQVQMHWQREGQPESSLQLGITAQWNAPAATADHCWCGFRIIDISETDQQLLDELIAEENT